MKKAYPNSPCTGAAPGSGAALDELAGQALAFLAADGERLGRFLALTGLDPGGIRAASGAPEFARAILAYICDDEALLVAFAGEVHRQPEAIGRLVRAEADRHAWDGG